MLVLLGATASTAQTCNYQQRICECDAADTVCYFSMVIEHLLSFTSYKLIRSSSGEFVRQVNGPSWTYFINDMGVLEPRDNDNDPSTNNTENPSKCIVFDEKFFQNNCSQPMIIDSTTEGDFIAINGLIPGPTFVVTFNQTVSIQVQNNLINEETSVHWHGMHQNSTPWMDGVGHITQCSIGTYSSFHYIFKAIPSGTMWYHSHVGTQRTEGLFGSLVVRESENVRQKAQAEWQSMLGETFTISDVPGHTISMLDWQRDDIVEISLKTRSDNPFFLSNENLNFPSLAFATPLGPDGAEVSRIPYWAGLMNGLGRQMLVPYERSRLSIFDVQYRDENDALYYRFRLVGAMNRYMYRFSISEHKLIVIATDGYLTEPKEVDYIHIHTGERYDFLLKPKTEAEANGKSNFRILAETVRERSTNIAEGFLHYGTVEDRPTSTEYEQIVNNTTPRVCNSTAMCRAVNCPFEAYPMNDYISCIPVSDLQLLFATEDEVPSNIIQTENQYFFDFSFRGSAGSAAINGRNFVVPSGSLQTQRKQEMYEDICQLGEIDCLGDPEKCICTQIIDLNNPFATIQFVISAVGDGGATYHPIHLHGHTFQVAGIFYGQYYPNQTLQAANPDITCKDYGCTSPGWTAAPVDGTVNNKTVRKDTIVVPAGGYVVIRFVADNWGYWYMHCHIELHFLEGMALVVNEAFDLQNPPPVQQQVLRCGNFNWTVEEFNEQLGMMNSALNLAGRLWPLIISLVTGLALLMTF